MYATQDPQSPPAPSHRRETSSRVRAPQRTASTTSRSEIPRQMQTIIGSVPLELREGTYPILKVDFKYLSHASPKSRQALAVVAAARISNGSPLIPARASATIRTYAGSLRFPRFGTGAR